MQNLKQSMSSLDKSHLMQKSQIYERIAVNSADEVQLVEQQHILKQNNQEASQLNSQQANQQIVRKRQKASTYRIVWSNQQVKKLFLYYNQYGSQWSFIETQFKNKTQNNLKNKFYATLKCLLRNLYTKFPISGNKFHTLSSIQVLNIYNAKKKYIKYKGLLIGFLETLNYKIVKKSVSKLAEQNQAKLSQLLKIIFPKQIKKIQKIIQIMPKNSKNQAVNNNLDKKEDNIIKVQERVDPHQQIASNPPIYFSQPISHYQYMNYLPQPVVYPVYPHTLYFYN